MFVNKIIDRFKHWNRDREAVNELMSRSDRELGDIGIRRVDVVRAVKDGTRR